MTSRRGFLHAVSFAAACVVSGCASLRTATTSVNIELMNFDTEERTTSIAVKQNDEVVFQTERTISARETEQKANTLQIYSAFEGADSEQFTVDVMLEGQPAGTYSYKITCADSDTEDLFTVRITGPDYDPKYGPTHFVISQCSE